MNKVKASASAEAFFCLRFGVKSKTLSKKHLGDYDTIVNFKA